MPTTKKNSAAPKSAAKAPKVPAVPTIKHPLPSGWVRQSTVPASSDIGASRFTTQTQRRLLRAIVAGESINSGEVPQATQRTIARLKDLGFVTVAKNGTVKATASGRTFVAANPAPRQRAATPKVAKKVVKRTVKAKVAKAPATGSPAAKKAAKARIAKVAKRA